MKCVKLFAVLLVSLLLTGCTCEADRIYTVCKQSDEGTFVYNMSGEFYQYDKESKELTPCSSIGLQSSPALQIAPKDGEFELKEDLPCKFNSTLDNLNCYLGKLISDGYNVDVTYADWSSLTLLATKDGTSLRMYYATDDTLRIYSSEISDISKPLPYTTREE